MFSFITIIVVAILLIITASLFLNLPLVRKFFYLAGLTLLIGLIAMGLFKPIYCHLVPFGIDQMLEASSDQLNTFIHWYY